ncbi:replication protein H [Halorhabdus sp. CBA1104]|uniref:DUF5817 domain-containing protein n=1 Tax=unclassified Halorhabdus TaxID=2621901 RepID=UPI0012B275AA|nr:MULTISPECIES: DUF5817 domain-containing protein [unclassified Halorhabdus]QGN06912.1 replication protein H [Halorhabdus sp. CBA1104]
MYAVVGCSACSALWVVEGRPETTQCPRCGKRRQFDRLKKFVETAEADAAREVRAAMLAERQDLGDAFDGLDSYAEMDDRVHEDVIDDETYLESKGVDSEQVNAAADRASAGATTGPSRREVVVEALERLDEPDEDRVCRYASEHGVSESYVRQALQSLVRSGQVTEERGTYRLL